jgi:hypothetical protein
VRAVTVLVAVVAVVCQFVQHTDPRFPLAYFTVDSVALLAVALSVGLVRRASPILAGVRGAAVVGVLVSSVVFTTVIAPHTSTGTWFQPWDDPWVRTSTVLMHAVTPVLALVDDWLHPAERIPGRWSVVLTWMAWPLAYIAVVGAVCFATGASLPYTFLQPSVVGAWTVVAGVAVMATLSIAAGWLVLGLRATTDRAGARGNPPRPAVDQPPTA